MDPQRYQRAGDLFLQAVDLCPEKRSAFLNAACAGDPALREDVDALLASDRAASGALEHRRILAALPLAAPERVGRYRILRELGRGGMGVVYLAEQDEDMCRLVALKLIPWGMDSEQIISRLEAERQALARMSHPNIAQVFDAGATAEGRPYFVMEYVDGLRLTDYCDAHRLSIDERLRLFEKVCDGVEHAHRREIIHRDLKPSNVLVAEQDGVAVPKIIDFGVAKATSHREGERNAFTEFGMMIGTLAYMSPEQLRLTEGDLDTRSDVYSLGVMLYELLVGLPPLDPNNPEWPTAEEFKQAVREIDPPRPSARAESLSDVRAAIAEARRTEPTRLCARLRGDLDCITMKAIDKDRTRRYNSPTDLALDIRRCLNSEPILAKPAKVAYLVTKYVRRHRLGVTIAMAGFAILAVFSAIVGLQARRTAIEHARADQEAQAAQEVAHLLEGLLIQGDPAAAESIHPEAKAFMRRLLDRAAASLPSDLEGRPAVQAQVMTAIARAYMSLGIYDAARPLLNRALSIRESTLGVGHPLAGEILSILGSLEASGGDLRLADTFYGQARQIAENANSPQPRLLADVLTRQADFFYRTGRYMEAEPLAARALEIREQSDPDGVELAETLAVIGALAQLHGDNSKMRTVFERARAIEERHRGPNHPRVASMLINLGVAAAAADAEEEAGDYYRRALEIHRAVYGDAHPTVAADLDYLGVHYENLGKPKEAEALYHKSLEIRRGKVWAGHPLIGWSKQHLGSARFAQGDFKGAQAYFEEAAEIRRRAYGGRHVEYATSLTSLAAVHLARGHAKHAEELARQAVTVMEDIFPCDINRHATVHLYAWAKTLRAIGRNHEAEAIETRIIAGSTSD
jgi:serine/threonine protein kinase